MHQIKKNLLIFIRHGERSDKVGRTPTFHKYDPELTENGKRQAFDIGKKLSNYLMNNYPLFKNIEIISSPFARTIQTSKYILNGLITTDYPNIQNSIKLNFYFSEYIKTEFPTFNFPIFLVVKNDIHKLLPDLHNTELIFHNEPNNIISQRYEDEEICHKRIQNGVKALLKNMIDDENKVIIVVSHGDPINFVNIDYGFPGPFGWTNIKYCNSFIYNVEIDKDQKSQNIMYIESFYPIQ